MSLHYFPVFLNLNDLKVLVIGGGFVGTKRALKLSAYTPNVTVFSLEFSKELKESNLKLIKGNARDIKEDFLRQFDIIFLATGDPQLNRSICLMAKKLGKLCNDPNDPEISSFIMPIFYEDEDIGIAVTTYGKSSTVSKYVMEKIMENVLNDPTIKTYVELMYEIKRELKKKINDPAVRYTLYHEIFNDEKFENFIKNKDILNARSRAEEIVNEHTGK
ncbi:MAG: bifunctional precorrin-2 dehydrogenase/sirohydrochlorin ferrochelatase [Candidatus Aramenus sp.]|nr:bifunctional precorrin-2 dehydrogenase/sirohydrochlorin ferrochelatase [Candidatus Aramenus sp.]